MSDRYLRRSFAGRKASKSTGWALPIRTSRRQFLRVAGAGALGASSLQLVGCGDDDDEGEQTATATAQGSESPSSPTPTPTLSGDQPDLTAELRTAIPGGPGSLDPHSPAGHGAGGEASAATHFTTLFSTDAETNAVVPYAADWEWVDNNSALVLSLVQGIRFHNGEELTAEQVKFNFDRVLGRAAYNPEFDASSRAPALSAVGEVSVVDPYTVRIELASPDVELVDTIGFILPIVEMNAVLNQGDDGFATDPVGFGPFVLDSFTPDLDVRSHRFEDFFYSREEPYGPRLPYVASLHTRFIPEQQARLAALEAGEIDFAAQVNPDLAKAAGDQSGFHAIYQPAQRGMHIQLPTTMDVNPFTGQPPNPWKDVRVRQAVNLAIDVDELIENLLTGTETHTYPLSEAQFGFPPALKEQRYGHDPARAMQLLAEAGFEDGFEFDIHYPAGRYDADIWVPAIVEQLREVGLTANPTPVDATQFFADVRTTNKLPVFVFVQGTALSPLQSMGRVIDPANSTVTSIDPELELDQLLSTARAQFDAEERRQTIEEIVRRHYESALWIYLFELRIANVASEKVEWPFYVKQPGSIEMWNVRKYA